MEKRQELEKSESLNSFHGSGYSKSMTSGLTGDSHSLSEGYAWERQTDAEFQWKNKWQNCMFFLGLTLSWRSFITFDSGDETFPTNNPINFMQVIVVYVLLGCPLIFLETFIGQFTRKGCLVFGNMMPIANGLGYLILVNTFFNAVFNIYICSILLFYVFLAVVNQPIPAWMLCLESYYSTTPNCVGRKQIDLCEPCYSPKARAQGPCFDPKIHNLSSYLFMNTVIYTFKERRPSDVLSLPDQKFAFHMGFTVFVLFVTILREVRDLDVPIRMWNLFTISAITIMTVVISFTCLRFQGLLFFFDVSWRSFIDFACWTETIKRVVVDLNLAEGGHILFGSFTPVTINTGTRSGFLCFASFSVFTLFHVFLFILKENFICQLNTDNKAFFDFSTMADVFALYPEALGTLASAPFWGTMYFLIAFGLGFQATILQILTIEISLSHAFLKSSYRLYTRCLILIVLALTTLPFLTPEGAVAAPWFYCYLSMYRVTIVFLYMIVVFTYGFQRLHDDVHFLLRNPPSCFYRYTWLLCLILGGAVFLGYFIHGNFYENRPAFYVLLLVLIGSLLLGFMLKFVVYLKARDLASLLTPSEVWGPVDPESRMVRRLFNPRFQVRFRRQAERCNHRCLLTSSVLKKTLEKELALVSNVLLEMEDNEEGRKVNKDLVDVLRMHRDLMSKFLAERAPGGLADILKKR